MRCFALLLFCLAGCATRYTPPADLGDKSEGARYYSGWLMGGPELLIYPNGKMVLWYVGGARETRFRPVITYDSDLWKRIEIILSEDGGLELIEENDTENALCDGGEERMFAKGKNGSAVYILDAMDCDSTYSKSDRAGRRIIEIMKEARSRLEEIRARR